VKVWIATRDGRFSDAEKLAGEALRIGRNLRGLDAQGVFAAHMFSIRREQGRLGEVRPALEVFLRSGASAWRPGLALTYAELGMREQAAVEFSAVSAGNFQSLPRDGTLPIALSYLAEVCNYLQDAEQATPLYELLKPLAGLHINLGVATAYYGPAEKLLGLLATLRGDWAVAERHFESALEQADRMGSPPQIAHTRLYYSRMLLKRGLPRDAARAREQLQMALEVARHLGMRTLEANASDALTRARATARQGRPSDLSDRELEVLKLLAAGCANKEIAARLYITHHTVANHVKNILSKTGAANRTEAATFATRSGLA
jgi:DNA-binding CsgD family transcriptional regulator